EIGRAELVEEDAGAAADAVARAVSDLTDALQSFQSSVNAQEPGDINNDGRHSVGDLGAMAVYYGKSSSDPDWDRIKAADLTGDGVVDIEDLARLAILILG
ncbi:dockerin type I repeat-containing protein, partial [Paenibacillus sepulcri]|nr:dockerin type I repeat-containing protein [Paenibacillus sepulcri]